MPHALLKGVIGTQADLKKSVKFCHSNSTINADGLQMSDEACLQYKTSKEFCRPWFNKHIVLLLWQNRIFDMEVGVPITHFRRTHDFIRDKAISTKQ